MGRSKRLKAGDCELSITDSTTSDFKKESDDESNNIEAKVRNEAARIHASLFIDEGVMEYSQWFKGISNKVSDSLSRDFHINDNKLTKIVSKLPYSLGRDGSITSSSSIKDNAITSCAPNGRLANSREKNRLNPTKDEDLQSSFLLQRYTKHLKTKILRRNNKPN